MRSLLGAEYPDYLAALASPPLRGLRVNTLKISVAEFLNRFSLRVTPSGYTESGFVLNDGISPGASPAHHAGLFYMQEPSATVAAEALRPHLGKRVLDLCAAPGGKSTQLACPLPADGVLVANEINFSRARILQSNIERMGIRNALVTCNSPADFAALMPGYFDAVLVDAPCSGEGMFRKEDAALRDWSPAAVEACARRQAEILDSAAKVLRPGGMLLYSTCTLNTLENEETIKAFLSRRDFETVPVHESLRKVCRPGFGLPDAIRIFPQDGRGEGHFACLLRKRSGDPGSVSVSLPYESCKEPAAFRALFDKLSRGEPFGLLRRSGEYLCAVPEHVPFVRGLNVLKAGVAICRVCGDGRLEPHHAFAAALQKDELRDSVSLSADAPALSAYLRGETLSVPAEFSGYGTLCVEGYPIGLVKAANGILKNHYPKGLRNL